MTHGAYNPLLVAGSILIAILASYTALDLANRLTAARGRVRLLWLIGGSLAMGLGIWSMHFIGMLALRLPVVIAYDIRLLILSVAVAIAASAVALNVVSRPRVTPMAVAVAGLVIGAAICGMHYIAIWSMQVGVTVAWDTRFVILSIAIAVVAAFLALWLAFQLRRQRTQRDSLRRAAGALVMGAAISGMHYTAMRAMTFTPLMQRVSIGREDVLATDGLAVAVVLTTMLVLAIALTSTIIDRALAHQAAIAEEAERRRRDAEESEARFRELAENIHEVFWIFTPDFTRTLYVSPAYEDIWGRSRETLYRDPQVFIETVHPDDRARMREMLARLREKGASAECRIVRPDGDVRWVRNRGFPVRNATGQIRRVVGVTEDITERKKSEEQQRFLKQASEVLARSLDYEDTLNKAARLAVPYLADWCYVDVSEHGRIRRKAVAHQDRRKEELVREITSRYPLDPESSSPVARVIRTGKPQILPEVTDDLLSAVARDDEHLKMLRQVGLRSAMVVPLLVRGQTFGAIIFGSAESGRRYSYDDLASAEELARLVAVAIDNALLFREAEAARITAERRAREEEALRQAAAAVSASFTVEDVIQQIAHSALAATDADGALVERIDIARDEVVVVAVAGERTLPLGSRLTFSGSLAESVITREEAELIPVLEEYGQISPDLVQACPRCSGLAVPLLDAGEAIGGLILLREPDRESFQSNEVDRAKIFASLAALAFRKVHLLEETEQRREELERLIESRARLIRGFSHDLKNPLGAADGYAQLLEDGLMGELSEKQKQSVGRIRRSIRSALELIDAIVEHARAEAGQIETSREPVDVREIARELVEEYRALAKTAGLTMTLEVPEIMPIIASDASRIRQILGNLISNAVKYTKEGRIVVRVEVREDERAPRHGRWVAVDVADTGIGIPEGKQHLLFQEFSRLGEDSSPGVGLGLAISYRIAHALGGNITVVSEAGRGSTFTLWLPADRP